MKPFELYILRHGIAESKNKKTVSDSHRRLTREGIKKIGRVVKAIKKSGLDFDLILTSPYVRAEETAGIVAQALGISDKLKICEALVADGNPRNLVEEIKKARKKSRRMLLVGHEPYLSNFTSLLISGTTGVSISLKKGGLIKMNIDELRYGRCATLEWLMTPAQAAAQL